MLLFRQCSRFFFILSKKVMHRRGYGRYIAAVLCFKHGRWISYPVKHFFQVSLGVDPRGDGIAEENEILDYPRWVDANHVAYTMAKYGMSMCVLGMAEEFKDQGVAVNALWPKTAIATAAVQNLLGGDDSVKKSRNSDIMSDSAYMILTSKSK